MRSSVLPAVLAVRMRAKTILRNSAWYYLDFGVSFAATMLLSVLVARKLGPSNLGFFNFVTWLTYAVGQFGSFGISTATRKYVAEHIGRGEVRRARQIVNSTLRAQSAIALFIGVSGLLTVWRFVEPEHQLYTALAVCSLIPYLTLGVFAQALIGAEDFVSNVQVSLIGTALNLGLVIWALQAGLGLTGITGALLVSRTADMILRAAQYYRKFPKPTASEPLSDDGAVLRQRMTRFYWQSSLLLLLNLAVWDRSEMLFLKYYSPITEVAFYSLAFNISTQLLNVPQIFSSASGAALMVEFGRDAKATGRLASTVMRYVCLIAFPLLIGMAALSSPAMRILYGSKYLPAIPVLALLCIFAIPRALISAIQQQMLAHERQSFLVVWGLATAALNAVVDWFLIPRGGAIGAALGNGIAQSVASAGIVVYAIRHLEVRPQWGFMTRTLASAVLMGTLVYPIGLVLPPIPAACVGVPLGCIVYLASLRWSGALAPDDERRLGVIAEKLPGPLSPWYQLLLRGMIGTRRAAAGAS